jgi:hypothetical protein
MERYDEEKENNQAVVKLSGFMKNGYRDLK